MNELPNGINYNGDYKSAFEGVEDKDKQTQLRALTLFFVANPANNILLNSILDKTMNDIELACYVYQHTNIDQQVQFLSADVLSKLS